MSRLDCKLAVESIIFLLLQSTDYQSMTVSNVKGKVLDYKL
jgi:hypothetical protein